MFFFFVLIGYYCTLECVCVDTFDLERYACLFGSLCTGVFHHLSTVKDPPSPVSLVFDSMGCLQKVDEC